MFKEDLALNNLKRVICNLKKIFFFFFLFRSLFFGIRDSISEARTICGYEFKGDVHILAYIMCVRLRVSIVWCILQW